MPRALLVGTPDKTSYMQSSLEGDGYSCRNVPTIAAAADYLKRQPNGAQITLVVQSDAPVLAPGGHVPPDDFSPTSAASAGKDFIAWVRAQDETISPDAKAYIAAVNPKDAVFGELPANTAVIEFGAKSIADQIRPAFHRAPTPHSTLTQK